MKFLTPPTWSLLLLGALAFACGNDQIVPATDTGGMPPAAAERIQFVPNSPLQLDPSAEALLAVEVSPKGKHTVRFGILEDNAGTASLSSEEIVTDSEGRGYVTLYASSAAGAFRVRASVGTRSVEAERPISVSALGFASVLLNAMYSGNAAPEHTEWIASAVAGVTCSDLSSFDEVGSIVLRGQLPLTLSALPVGPPLAITLRAGGVLAGCTTVRDLVRDEVRPLRIMVTERPISLRGRLALNLNFKSVEGATAKLLQQASLEAQDRFAGLDVNWAQSFVTELRAQLPPDARTAFDERSLAEEWSNALTAQGNASEAPPPTLLEEWLASAILGMTERPGLQGVLDVTESPYRFDPVSLSGVPAPELELHAKEDWTLLVESDRSFTLSGSWTVRPQLWLRGTIVARLNDQDTSPTVELARAVDCEEIENLLESPAPNVCDALCLRNACSKAIESLWERTWDFEQGDLPLVVAAGGIATPDPNGALASLDGEWLGSVEGSLSLKGQLTANSLP